MLQKKTLANELAIGMLKNVNQALRTHLNAQKIQFSIYWLIVVKH